MDKRGQATCTQLPRKNGKNGKLGDISQAPLL
jgi:hypothetical protein